MKLFKFLSVSVILFPLFLAAATVPHKTNGYFEVQALQDGKWQKVGEISFSEFESEAQLALPDNFSELKFVKNGGGAAHIDMVKLNGISPLNEPLMAFSDKALYHVKGDTVVKFRNSGKSLQMAARIEPVKILPFAFDFPKVNQFKKIQQNSAFYNYRPGSSFNPDEDSVLFSEKTVPGSGHPEGNTVTYVWNDKKNLYIKIDFTPDNTMDGGKDYTAVHIRQGNSVKTFRMSMEDTVWGIPEFKKTANADYPHKVYSYKIPLSEIDVDKNGIDMAFSAYGTAAPQLILTDAEGFDYGIEYMRYDLVILKGNDDYPDYSAASGRMKINDTSFYDSCNLSISEDGRMFICDLNGVNISGLSNSLNLKRTLFVPSGKNYARATTTITNPGSVSADVNFSFENYYSSVYTDSHFQKTGGTLADPGAWLSLGSETSTLAAIGEIKYGSGDGINLPAYSNSGNGYYETWSVTIPAGGSVTVMFYLIQNTTVSKVENVIDSLYSENDSSMFAGLDSKLFATVINWKLTDNDSDGMIDQWEKAHGLDPSADDSALDKDGDGLTNKEEFDLGSNPDNKDTDGDGIEDKTEYDSVPQTSLTASDSDGDGFHDGDELLYGSDPLDDTDHPVITEGTYYVDSAAKGLGHGTESDPWKSFEYAAKMLSNGTAGSYTLKLADGTYTIESLEGAKFTVSDITIEGSGNSILKTLPIYSGIPMITIDGGTIKNVIFESNNRYTQHIGIKVLSSDVTVEDCEFMNISIGIMVEGADSFTVKRSVFIDASNGIQIVTGTSFPTKVENCYFTSLNIAASGFYMGTAFDVMNTTGAISFEHNTITDFAGTGLYFYNATGTNTIRYNIFDALEYGVYLEDMGESNTTTISWNYLNNCSESGIFSESALYTAADNVADTDPLLAEDSYSLQSTSPAIDAIDDITDEVSEDIDGKARPYGNKKDIGCWEYYPEFTVTFVAGENGSIEGELSQTVYSGYSTSEVTAVPDTGYEFSGWTGDYMGTENPLTIENVTADMTVNAVFTLTETPDEMTDDNEITDNEKIDNEVQDDAVTDNNETPDASVIDENSGNDESAETDDLTDDESGNDKKDSGSSGCSLSVL